MRAILADLRDKESAHAIFYLWQSLAYHRIYERELAHEYAQKADALVTEGRFKRQAETSLHLTRPL